MDKVGIIAGDNDVWPVLVTPQAGYKDYFVDVVEDIWPGNTVIIILMCLKAQILWLFYSN